MTFRRQHNSYLTDCQTKMSRDLSSTCCGKQDAAREVTPGRSTRQRRTTLPVKPLFTCFSVLGNYSLRRVYAPLSQGQEAKKRPCDFSRAKAGRKIFSIYACFRSCGTDLELLSFHALWRYFQLSRLFYSFDPLIADDPLAMTNRAFYLALIDITTVKV